jgi:hypothetical protein
VEQGTALRDKLTALKVAKLNKPGRYADGGGLYLHIPRPGAQYWSFRYMIDGKAREMSLGPVSDVGLAQARELAVRARAMVRDKVDPIEAREKAQRAEKLASLKAMTFREAAEQFLGTGKIESLKSDKHRKQWRSTLESHAFPVLGDMIQKHPQKLTID